MEPGRDELVDLADLGMQLEDLLRERLHDLRAERFAGQGDLLAAGGLDRAPGQRVGVAGLAGAQPALHTSGAQAADRRRGLVAGQQRQRALAVAEVEASLQSRKDGKQLLT